MRVFLLLLIVIPLLALGLDLYFKERAQERDARLVATANRLLIEASTPSQADKTVEIRRIAEAEPGLWQVQGHITLKQDGSEKRSAYSVEIEQRCGDLQDDACWQPHALVIGEERLLDKGAAPSAVAAVAAAPQAAPSDAAAPSQGSASETRVDAKASGNPPSTAKSPPESAFVAAIAEEPAPLPDQATVAGAEPGAMPESGDSESSEGPGSGLETVEMSVEESLIWLIQDRLARLGYGKSGTLRATGALDAPTRGAIEAYQSAHSLPQDGEPSFELLDHIQAETAQRHALAAAQPAAGQQIGEQAVPNAPAAPSPAAPGPTTASSQPASPPPASPATALPSASPQPAPAVGTAAEPVQTVAEEAAAATEASAEAENEAVAVDTAAPSWDTPVATGAAGTALADLEEQVAPAAGDSLEAERDETLPEAQGDADLEPADLELTPEPAAAPQQARVPEVGGTVPPPPSEMAPEAAPDAADETASADESLVFLIQDRLNRLGYDKPTPIKLDGRMGARTRLAIFDYQQKNRLPKDGEPSEALLRHLEATLLGKHGATASSSE